MLNGAGVFSVSGAGDVNGDGFDDIVIGNPSAEPNGYNSGQSYVVFGTSGGFPEALELSALDGSNGFTLNGGSTDGSGFSVSGAGDVNGDGFDDLVIGAPDSGLWGGDYSGVSYVVFGKSSFSPVFELYYELSGYDGNNNSGFAFNSTGEPGDNLGFSVSGAGDVNGDGFDDLVIGAPSFHNNGDDSGQVYVVFGGSDGISDSAVLNGTGVGDHLGTSVSGAGDINGDGFSDFIIDNHYVVFGTGGEFPSVLESSALDGSNGFVLNSIAAVDESGFSVSGAGDVNGDGVDDLVIGASGASPNDDNSGQSYVVFGTDGGFPAALELSTLDGASGFVLNGSAAVDESGFSVSGAGDVNGDGVDDILIGAPGAAPNGVDGAGRSYVVYGASSFPAVLELSALDGSNGFALNGSAAGDRSGRSVGGAGDVNGDGFDDFLIGAPNAGPNGAGQSYVVFGTPSAGGGPAALLTALIADVKALDLPKRLGHRLVTKLERAQKKLAQDYVAEAFYKVLRFTQQVRAQRGWRIPETGADALIAQAKPILDGILKVWYGSFKPAANHAHDPSLPQ